MLFHFAKFSAGKNNRQYKCSCVGNRSCIHNAIDSHKHREDNDQWKQEDHLSGERHDDTEASLSYRSKKSGGHRLDTICESQEHKNPQIIFCEFKVQIASAAKHADNLMWKDLEAQEKECGNDRTCCCRITICLTNTVVFFSSIVKAPDRLCTLGNSNADRKKNHIYF